MCISHFDCTHTLFTLFFCLHVCVELHKCSIRILLYIDAKAVYIGKLLEKSNMLLSSIVILIHS